MARIVLLSPFFNPALAFQEWVLAKYLARAGHAVTVVSSPEDLQPERNARLLAENPGIVQHRVPCWHVRDTLFPKNLRRIRELCSEHGIVLVADEIQCGMGRTGKLFASEHYGVEPDLVTVAKSLAAGMPLAAVVGKADIVDAPHPGGLGGTYSGSPLACAAALEAVNIIRDPAFLARANAVGDRLQGRLERFQRDFPAIVDVRGLGPMLALEFTHPDGSPDPDAVVRIVGESLRRGLIVLRAGLYSNCLRFLPPLNLTDAELDEGLDVLHAALGAALPKEAALQKEAVAHD